MSPVDKGGFMYSVLVRVAFMFFLPDRIAEDFRYGVEKAWREWTFPPRTWAWWESVEFLTARCGVCCTALRDSLYPGEKVPLILSLLRVFITERALDFVECCSCIFWLDHVIFLS